MKHSFCEDWEFTRHWTEAFGKGLPVPKQEVVRLPHTCREVPLHYASPADYEMVCGYRKRFRVPPVQAAPRLFLRFDGAAHQAVVRVNGRVAGQHRGGYTGFAVEITDLVDREGENLLTVQLDTREDPAIPPFGFVIDYLTYGGLYREVWLEATAESRLTDLFVYTPTLHDAVVQWTAELAPAAVAVRIRLETADGTLLAEQTAQAAETGYLFWTAPKAKNVMDEARFYAIYRFKKGEKVNLSDAEHLIMVTPSTMVKLPYENGKEKYTYVVAALDRVQNESKAVKKKVKL